MVKRGTEDIAAIIEDEVAAIEDDRDAPIPGLSRVRRGNGRSKTLQVRLNPEELAELERLAASRGLPTSTVAREAIIGLIRPDIARTAAANRLIEEFARYIDTLGAAGNLPQSVPHAPVMQEEDPRGAPLSSGARESAKRTTPMSDYKLINLLSGFDPADLDYEVYTDSKGKIHYRITGLSDELLSTLDPDSGGRSFLGERGFSFRTESHAKAAAMADLARLRTRIDEARRDAMGRIVRTHDQ